MNTQSDIIDQEIENTNKLLLDKKIYVQHLKDNRDTLISYRNELICLRQHFVNGKEEIKEEQIEHLKRALLFFIKVIIGFFFINFAIISHHLLLVIFLMTLGIHSTHNFVRYRKDTKKIRQILKINSLKSIDETFENYNTKLKKINENITSNELEIAQITKDIMIPLMQKKGIYPRMNHYDFELDSSQKIEPEKRLRLITA